MRADSFEAGAGLFLLSQFHRDHMDGMDGMEKGWSDGQLVASHETCLLLRTFAATYLLCITAKSALGPSPLPFWWLRPVAGRGVSEIDAFGLFSPPGGRSSARVT